MTASARRPGESRNRRRKSAPVEIVGRDDDKIEVAAHRLMLEPVIEDVHRRAEHALSRHRNGPLLTENGGRERASISGSSPLRSRSAKGARRR
jgi:hypothetical protein